MEIKDKELHRVTATCIIYKDGKYLVTKRSPHKKVHPNKWTVPGGGLNIDDYIDTPQTHGNAGWYGAVEKALRREVKEEVKDQPKGFRTKKLDAARKKKAMEIEGMTEEAMEVKKREQMKQKRPDIIVWGGYE